MTGQMFKFKGHTDNVGQKQYNMKLSEERAESVHAYLEEKGALDHLNVQIKGYGDTKPIAPNDTKANQQKNRRVEIVIEPKTWVKSFEAEGYFCEWWWFIISNIDLKEKPEFLFETTKTQEVGFIISIVFSAIGVIFFIPMLLFVYLLFTADNFLTLVISISGLTFFPFLLIQAVLLMIKETKRRYITEDQIIIRWYDT